MKNPLHIFALMLPVALAAHAQVNSGSNGSDGAFNPTTNVVIMPVVSPGQNTYIQAETGI